MIIYKTTNITNGKVYVGYDTKNNPTYFGSGTYYKNAEKKYGKENFRKSIIDSDEDFSDLCLKEIFWIDFYDARNPSIGYNILEGGRGHKGPRSEETKKKISESHKGITHTEETKLKIKLKNAGRIHTEESRRNMGLSRLGKKRKPFSEDHRRKLSILNKGRRMSEETKLKISNTLKGKCR